jgi:hypothetical protein
MLLSSLDVNNNEVYDFRGTLLGFDKLAFMGHRTPKWF